MMLIINESNCEVNYADESKQLSSSFSDIILQQIICEEDKCKKREKFREQIERNIMNGNPRKN